MTDAAESIRRSTAAVLLAAGGSMRMRAGGDAGMPRKPFLLLEGLTLLEHACGAFMRAPSVREIVLVAHPDDFARLRELSERSPALAKVRQIVAGGEQRTDSVRAGVEAVGAELALIAVHDVARPLIDPELIERAIAVAAQHGAALVALPVTDTIKTSDDGTYAQTTLDRSVLWRAQTPQVFAAARLRALLERARKDNFRPTDDAALHEKYAGPVPIVVGDAHNLKLTTPDDLLLAAAILRARETQGGRRA